MWVTALASILLLAVYIIVKVFVWPRWQYRAIERLPGPKRNFMGTLAAFEMGDRFLEKCRENMLFYKTTFRAWLGPNFPVVYCVDLEHVEKVLREPTVVKGYSYEFLYQWLGQSVLVAPGGPALARRRKIFSHGFRTEVVKYFVSTFRPHVNKLIRSLETAADRAEPVDVLKETAKLSLDVIAECGMGAQVNAQDEADSPYLKALDSIVRGLFERILNPLLHFNVTWYLSSLGRRLRRNISTFNATSYRVLDERQRLRAQGVADVRQDFLTILLDARLEDGTALSREFIINEVNTFMFAGHDTTATATLFTLACLAKNRQYAELVREEADRLLKDDITVEMLDSLKFTQACVYEAMRLYPPVPAISRTLSQPMEISGVTVPPGVECNICLYAHHRNPDIWPQPSVYDPNRFIGDAVLQRHSAAFIPFAVGPRQCLGMKLGLLESTCVVASLVQRFDFELVDPEVLSM
eukprot:TRINITY_DN3559_c0_g1_i5.p1 TRINITY_DN3559_c0_g1~~TRINITY_DN3559_c0_g1_i5.p1  ORF type:complete len:467 (+),score=94.53 TRINITY_DN3559_c0_g1_i5:24-1424(+)